MAKPVFNMMLQLGADVAELRTGMKKANSLISDFGKGAKRSLHDLKLAFAGVFTVYELKQFATALKDAGLRSVRLDAAFKSITGSAQSANKELAFIRSESNRLGVEFYSAAESFKGVMAAAQGTALEGQGVRDIFTGLSEAAVAMSLSSDEVAGSLYAISQMMNKGKVQAEELRGQLGERLPGAYKLAAEAMGITTEELANQLKAGRVFSEDLLPKMAKLLHEKFGDAAVSAAQNANAAFNRFYTAVNTFLADVAQSGALDQMSASLDEINKLLQDPANVRAISALATSLGWAATQTLKLVNAANLAKNAIQDISGRMLMGGDTDLERLEDRRNYFQKEMDFAQSKLDKLAANPLYNQGVSRSELKQDISRYKALIDVLNQTLAKERIMASGASGLLDLGAELGGQDRWNIPESEGTKSLGGKSKEYPYGKAIDDLLEYVMEDAKQRKEIREAHEDFYASMTELSGNYLDGQLLNIKREKEEWINSGIDRLEAEKWAQEAIAQARLEYSQEWEDGFRRGMEEYIKETKDLASQVENAFSKAMTGMEDAIVNFVTTGKLEFEDFANSIIEDWARILTKTNITGPLTEWAEGGGAVSWISQLLTNAKGNAFGHGGVIPFAKGGVVNRPTVFPFANGIGLMGESGPEAILPLKRGVGGALGVQSSGGAQNVRVEIINESGQKMKVSNAQARFDAQEMVVTAWLDAFDRNAYGLRNVFGG